MSQFHLFKEAVSAQFARMQAHPLYRASVDKDELWETYLASFPAGTNEIYRERREHDCSCCKQFIRAVGDVVAIIDGKVVSIWDSPVDAGTYDTVSGELEKLVKAHPIAEPFLHYERTAGTDKSFEERIGAETAVWQHFHINLPPAVVKDKKNIPTLLGAERTKFETLYRALTEIKSEAVATVIELINQGTLYRGQEHFALVSAFQSAQRGFYDTSTNQMQYTWTVLQNSAFIAGIRNSVIGTLLVDLSEGKDIEQAVKSYEVKVAPTNYKRPTALITPMMIAKAKEKIEDLGLSSALDRRYAIEKDLSVNDVLWVDRASKKKVAKDVFDDLASTASSKPKKLDKIETVTIDKFISDVLPKVDAMEVMLEGKHSGNLVTLIAPSDPTAGRLFKWDNGFSWAYNGDVADSIKERVKAAGGNVSGDLCCRLAWDYDDDLDFHMHEPSYGHIYYGTRGSLSHCGGQLDVDANAGGRRNMDHPVENIFYHDRRKMKEGEYHLLVNNYFRRGVDSKGKNEARGFDAEIDYLGDVQTFRFDKALHTGERITVARFKYTHAKGIEVLEGLKSTAGSKSTWGMQTNQYQKVKLMTLSPNCWGDQHVGNKHFIFVLDGAKNESDPRGFFNEFLRNDLNEYRKTFEVVGSKMKAVDKADEQLSGLGFSVTKKDELLVRVTGSFTRTLRIQF